MPSSTPVSSDKCSNSLRGTSWELPHRDGPYSSCSRWLTGTTAPVRRRFRAVSAPEMTVGQLIPGYQAPTTHAVL